MHGEEEPGQGDEHVAEARGGGGAIAFTGQQLTSYVQVLKAQLETAQMCNLLYFRETVVLFLLVLT